MQLRDYQKKGKQLVSEAFRDGAKAVVLCVPTGGGKTIILSDMAVDAMRNGARVMVVCDRKELIAQANEKLKMFGLSPTLIIPSYKDKISILYLASVDTLRNRIQPNIDLLIIDEAHKKTFDKLVLEYKAKGAYVVGCTATPVRTGKRFLEEFPQYKGQMCNVYDDIVVPTTITELIKENHLVPAITYGANIDLSDVKTKGDDFDDKELFNKFNKPKLYAGVVDNYLKLAANTKALVFNINVEHSLKMTAEFNARGIKSAHVDGNLPLAERDQIFKDFKAGKITVLNNCNVATTGYDEPTIETIIVNRGTMSLSLWLQMAGRGGRKCDEINKTYFTLIDQGGNVWRHGFWQDEREYKLDPKFVTKKKGVAPVKECSNCQALLPASSPKCEYCDMVQEKRSNPQSTSTETAEFVVIDKLSIPQNLKKPLAQLSISELEEFRVLKEYQLGWIVRQLIPRGEDALKEYARLRGFQSSWVDMQLRVGEKFRQEAKDKLWAFIVQNPHLDDDYISGEAWKTLKMSHTPQQIEALIPKILEAKGKLNPTARATA
jgi:superfamily II DNA or RNA helicase